MSSTRFVVTADLHIHPHRSCSRDNGADRLADGLSALRQTLGHARQHACPWVFCGDLKIPRHTWVQEAQNGILAAFEEYRDVEKVMLPGNHDGEGVHGTGLRAFAKHARVIERGGEVTDWGGPPVCVWPSGGEPAEILPTASRAQILLGHAFLAGALLGPDDLHATSPATLESFGFFGGSGSRWKLGVFGDIHKGQMLVRDLHRAPRWVSFPELTPPHWRGPWTGQVVYPGSPYQQNWGERADGSKGCLLVEEDQLTLLPVEAPLYVEEEWSEQKGGSVARVLDGNADLLAELRMWPGNFVRVLAGPWAHTSRWQKLFAEIRERARPRAFQLLVAAPDRTEQRADLHAGMATRDLLKAYITARPLTGVGRRDLLRAGELLVEGREEEKT